MMIKLQQLLTLLKPLLDWLMIIILVTFAILLLPSNKAVAKIGCSGRMVNPITDVCWKCLLPITIGDFTVVRGSGIDTPPSTRSPICFCPNRGALSALPGITIGFWEPVRLVDITKSPMCMVSLGGISLGSSPRKGMRDDTDGTAFYHVHWYIYPVIYWLEILLDFACLEAAAVDIAYLTEFDPLWGDDTKTAILNPEAILFGNIIAQSACTADCLTSTTGLANDAMIWCCGCQGSLYPFTGTVTAQNGGVSASVLIVSRFMAKLHRELLLWGYLGEAGLCGKYPMPIIKKSQYRMQMTYPIPELDSCKRIGQTEVLWQAGKEFPVKGEDFGFLIWRKRSCCLF